ncbi:MAG: hypothetical protein ACOY4R_02705 [Pseudomonadota bacterium]
MRVIGLVLLLLCGQAAAQTASLSGTPEPRKTLDVPLPSPTDHRLFGFGPPGRLAVAPDGTLIVALSSFEPSFDGILPARSARIELLAFAPEGASRYRTALPVQAGVGKTGFNAESLGVVAYPSGETAVFLSSSNQRMAMPQNERDVTTLFRVTADGKVRSATRVAPATSVAGGFYLTRFYIPSPEGGLLVGGGFGADPFNWWIGAFGADDRRRWQAGPGPGYPEDVYGLAILADGSVSAIIQEIQQSSSLSQWYVARFAADGTPRGRMPFNTLGTSFARLPAYWVSAISGFDTAGPPALVRLDDQGNVLGRAPWPFDQTRRMIPHGDGIAAVVCADAGPLCFVVRADLDGKILWRSEPGNVTDIAPTPDGQIAAVIWSADDFSARLVRFAAP